MSGGQFNAENAEALGFPGINVGEDKNSLSVEKEFFESEWCTRRESNPDLWLRRPLFYPLNYRCTKGRFYRDIAAPPQCFFSTDSADEANP